MQKLASRRITGPLFRACRVVVGLGVGMSASEVWAGPGTLGDSNGQVVVWGENTFGQQAVPSSVFGVVSDGGNTLVGVKGDGTLVGWGDLSLGRSNVPTGTFSSVVVGPNLSLGLRTAGTIAAWGVETFGQISNVPSGTFLAVSGGENFSAGVRSNGTLFAWGQGINGETNVPAGSFTAVSTSYAWGAALRTDGTVAAWGRNDFGVVSGAPDADCIAVSVGADFGVAVDTNGFLLPWGDDLFGQVSTAPSGTFIGVDAGNGTGVGIRNDGTLAGWGRDDKGVVSGVPGGIFTAVSVGANSAAAMRAATNYSGDLRVFGTGMTATLNRSVTVGGNATIESSMLVVNQAALSVGGNLTIYAGATVASAVGNGDGIISVGGKVRLVKAFGPGVSEVDLYTPVSSVGALEGDADVFFLSPVRFQFGLSNAPAYSGTVNLSAGATLVFTGVGLQSCASLHNFQGTVRLGPGQGLESSSASDAMLNAGTILLNSSSVGQTDTAELTSQAGLLNNSTGLISARNALISAAVTTNNGGIAFTGGTSDFLGKVSNTATGQISITNGATVVFHDDVKQNGSFVIRKLGTVTATAVFLGSFSGANGFTGGGTAFIEGDLAPGNSPSSVMYDGSVAMGATARTVIEIGGLTPGTQFDQIHVSGEFDLGGILDVRLIDGFVPPYFPFTFNIVTAGSLVGDFDQVVLPSEFYAGGWSLERSGTAINLTHFTVVPEAGMVGVMPALLAAGGMRRRR